MLQSMLPNDQIPEPSFFLNGSSRYLSESIFIKSVVEKVPVHPPITDKKVLTI